MSKWTALALVILVVGVFAIRYEYVSRQQEETIFRIHVHALPDRDRLLRAAERIRAMDVHWDVLETKADVLARIRNEAAALRLPRRPS